MAGHFVPGWLYNIGTTVLNGGISMVVFFVSKTIFPKGEPRKKYLHTQGIENPTFPSFEAERGIFSRYVF